MNHQDTKSTKDAKGFLDDFLAFLRVPSGQVGGFQIVSFGAISAMPYLRGLVRDAIVVSI